LRAATLSGRSTSAGLGAALNSAQHQVADAAAGGAELAFAPQPIPPGGGQVAARLRHPVERDVAHVAALLGRAAGLVEVLGPLPVGGPHRAQRLDRLVRLLCRLLWHGQTVLSGREMSTF